MENKSKDITTVLAEIQSSLVAPKNQFNSFGNYKYRNCEDILEALKPLLKKHDTIVKVDDEIVLIGDRYYVKSTATLFLGTQSIGTTAYAREPQDRKGMDSSQITGATSSYARKYALNGLFLIDDSKDADATNTHGDNAERINNKQMGIIRDQLLALNKQEDKFCAYMKISKLEDMLASDFGKAQLALDQAKKRGAK